MGYRSPYKYHKLDNLHCVLFLNSSGRETHMPSLFSVIVLSVLVAVLSLSVTAPAIKASTNGPLEELGEMLGIDGNNDSDEVSNSDGAEETQNTLAAEEGLLTPIQVENHTTDTHLSIVVKESEI